MDTYIGEICFLAFERAPRGFVACNGQLLPIARYGALFALIGTTYGGDGRSNFAVPNLKGKSPLDDFPDSVHYFMCVEGVFPSTN